MAIRRNNEKSITGLLLLIAAFFMISCDGGTDVADGVDQINAAAKDVIYGTNDDEFQNGTQGNDYLYPEGGNDIINPQGGTDYIYIEKHYDDPDKVYMYAGKDTVDVFISRNKPEQNAFTGKLAVCKFASTTGTKRVNVYAKSFARLTYACYPIYPDFYVKHKVGGDVIYKIIVNGYTGDSSTHWCTVRLQ